MSISGSAVAIIRQPNKNAGYVIISDTGAAYALGSNTWYGSVGITLNQPIIDAQPTPTGNGYWMFAKDGGIFAFGDAGSYGTPSLGSSGRAIVPTASGQGYSCVDASGSVYSYGNAGWYGNP